MRTRTSTAGGRAARRAPVLLLALCGLCLTGCITRLFGGAGEPTVKGEKGEITLAKLERLILTFADRDVALVSDACEAVKRGQATTEEKRQAQHFKLANGTAVYDIVSSPNALGHLVELYVMIHLQHLVMVDEGTAGKLFGEAGAERVSEALGHLTTEIDHLATLAIKDKRRAQLDQRIQEWRKRNPTVEFVTGVRFGSMAELSGKSVLEIIPSFFDVLNPLDDTSKSVDESRQLAERAFYFGKKLPELLQWETDAAVDDFLVKPGLDQVLKNLNQTSGSIDRVSKVLERVPELVAGERKEFLAAWDSRQEAAVSTVKEIRATLLQGTEFAAEVRSAAKVLESTLDSLHRVIRPGGESAPKVPSKPFDITEYTAAAAEIGQTVRDANSLLDSPAWTKRQEEASRLAGDAVASAERGSRNVVDHAAWRMVQVIAVFFALLLCYRVVWGWLERRRGTPVAAGTATRGTPPPQQELHPTRKGFTRND